MEGTDSSSIYIWMIHMANLYIIVMMQATEFALVCQMIESELFGSLLFHGVHAVYGLVVAKRLITKFML